MSIIGTIATVAVGTLIPGGGLALAVWKFGGSVVIGKLRDAETYLVAHPMTAVAVAAALFGLIERGEAQHWKKVGAGHVALISAVKVEVDRGVGQPTVAEQAPAYIRAFVDNVRTLKDALDRQSAALRVAQQQAVARRQAASEAAQPTPAQRQRDKDRQKIVTGTGALTPEEWGKL